MLVQREIMMFIPKFGLPQDTREIFRGHGNCSCVTADEPPDPSRHVKRISLRVFEFFVIR